MAGDRGDPAQDGPTSPQRRFGGLLVVGQFALIALCLLPVGPTLGPGLRPLGLLCLGLAAGVGGLALVALGSDTRVHPAPHGTATLHTHGIYAWIRHPMYTAVLLACSGVTLSTARVLSVVALLCLGVVLTVKRRFEDHLLEQRFGMAFEAYRDRVPALIPRPRRSAAR